MIPPKPQPRPDKVSLRQYLKLFRQDLLSAQPERLYRARMAEFRTPFFRSYMVNEPSLIDLVLKERPDDFPKSDRVGEGLRPLLGNSIFVTNGEEWKHQRRIIDQAFEGGRLRETFPAMWAAAQSAVARLPTGKVEIEEQASHAAADVIFRALFSLPIESEMASWVFQAFRAHQRTQPILNLGAFLPLPRWMPRFHKRASLRTAREIRQLITRMTSERLEKIKAGQAPDDLATKIMTTVDPQTSTHFSAEEMVDQVAIFFLAGHETSASALAWAIWLLAAYPDIQTRVAKEARALGDTPQFSDLSKLPFTRDVFREVLRLYPPVPMMVRENKNAEEFRNRSIKPGAQIVLSPWHLHRNDRYWRDPDAFDPDRWQSEEGRAAARQAYMPFSAGPRVCTGAGFAMAEGVLLIAALTKSYRFEIVEKQKPRPVAYLTVRGKSGIWVNVYPA